MEGDKLNSESDTKKEQEESSFGERKPFQCTIIIDCEKYYKKGEEEQELK